MSYSVFDLFRIGIGPSSSHTVGPMRAAHRFTLRLEKAGHLAAVRRVRIEFFGSLGATGRGHASDRAVLLGLAGCQPETVDRCTASELLDLIASERGLHLVGSAAKQFVSFDPRRDFAWHARRSLEGHPNGMRFLAYSGLDSESPLLSAEYYSPGGGTVVAGPASPDVPDVPDQEECDNAFPDVAPDGFTSAAQLVALATGTHGSIAAVMRARERHRHADAQIDARLLAIWQVMQDCVARGCAADGILPGGLGVRRRAPALHRRLSESGRVASDDPLTVLDWVSLYALAVNEENAAGGRMVTAPTNGAAGIVPAVLHYAMQFIANGDERRVMDFLLTAAAVGLLYRTRASISGAEVGCQGEVGVACSMAAAGLCAVMGGTPAQVANAAEIGMEHHLGLTCDPVGGLVQIPCIERNAIGAVKAIQAARLALEGDGCHRVSLDTVIEVMRKTGADMKVQYKETSRGGLAIQVAVC
jgi:L-serine dehydratase